MHGVWFRSKDSATHVKRARTQIHLHFSRPSFYLPEHLLFSLLWGWPCNVFLFNVKRQIHNVKWCAVHRYSEFTSQNRRLASAALITTITSASTGRIGKIRSSVSTYSGSTVPCVHRTATVRQAPLPYIIFCWLAPYWQSHVVTIQPLKVWYRDGTVP